MKKNKRISSEKKEVSYGDRKLSLRNEYLFIMRRIIIFRKLMLNILIPLIFLAFWIVISLVFNNRISFSVLEYGDKDAVINGKVTGKIYKGDKVFGEFVAKDNYLGIVSVRFGEFVVPDYRGEDVLVFRLKEKGAKNWHYVGGYRSGVLRQILLFPFGIPPINDSKGKTYQFEIQSMYGNSTNAVQLSSNRPIIRTAYQFPKKEIAGSKLRIIKFLFKKIINSFTDLDFLLSSVIYLLPFLFYLLTRFKKKVFQKKIFAVVMFSLIVLDTFLIREIYMGVLIGLIFTWILSVKFYKLKSKVNFLLSFSTIFIWIVLTYFGMSSYSPKLNIWSYFLLTIAVFQLVFETRPGK